MSLAHTSDATPAQVLPARPRSNPQKRVALLGLAALGLIAAIGLAAPLVPESWYAVNPAARGLPPSLAHPMGTDLLGRDLAARTLSALGRSIWVGFFSAALSTLIALAIGLAASLDRRTDRLLGGVTELALGLPHFVLLILICYAAGGGTTGVIIAVSLTHWPRLSRVLRHEAQTVLTSDYVMISRALGRSPGWIARRHLVPHLLPQLAAGFVLIFPHAILHEAGLSFIGLGIEPHLPSIGMMLSESLRGLMAGKWWIAAGPGLALMLVALCFELLGERLRKAADPRAVDIA